MQQPVEALRWVPRERSSSPGVPGPAVYGRTADGGFCLVPDADGDLWDPDWPVMMVDWFGARAFARWEAERTGLPWRLPCELEWEKAARGVDQRVFPWGSHYDPSFTCMIDSRPDGALPAPVGTVEGDESPYGVRDMAGNIQDWCLDAHAAEGPAVDSDGRVLLPTEDELADSAARRSVRGGCWYFTGLYARVAVRYSHLPTFTVDSTGFRLVRSL